MDGKKYFFIVSIIILFNIEIAHAQSNTIFITLSSTMDKIIFDGKWTDRTEWKNSSLDIFSYDDGTTIHLRTAHQDDFIYIFVDVPSDTHLNKVADRALICFDTQNDKSVVLDDNDYCFMTTLAGKRSFVYQGDSNKIRSLKEITGVDGFVAVGSTSDTNDRYSTTPHPSYEFKIPTDLIGRSNIYGFYLTFYDAQLNRVYSWPQQAITYNFPQIPSPTKWGEMVSPDKSLPEFHWPLISFLAAIFLSVYFAKINQACLDRQAQ